MLHQAMKHSIVILFSCGLVRGTPLLNADPRSLTPGGRPNIDFGTCPEVQVVTSFQTSQYLGDWYAAYANPTWFQSELTAWDGFVSRVD